MISRKKKYNPPEICDTAVVLLETMLVVSNVDAVTFEEMISIEGQQVDGFFQDADLDFTWSWE